MELAVKVSMEKSSRTRISYSSILGTFQLPYLYNSKCFLYPQWNSNYPFLSSVPAFSAWPMLVRIPMEVSVSLYLWRIFWLWLRLTCFWEIQSFCALLKLPGLMANMLCSGKWFLDKMWSPLSNKLEVILGELECKVRLGFLELTPSVSLAG